jgi:hypothetical protein
MCSCRLLFGCGQASAGRLAADTELRRLGYGAYAAFFKAALLLHWFYYLYIISECQN